MGMIPAVLALVCCWVQCIKAVIGYMIGRIILWPVTVGYVKTMESREIIRSAVYAEQFDVYTQPI